VLLVLSKLRSTSKKPKQRLPYPNAPVTFAKMFGMGSKTRAMCFKLSSWVRTLLKRKTLAKSVTIVLLLLASLCLIGCDKREMEEREYVTAIGIDADQNTYTLTLQTHKQGVKPKENEPAKTLTATARTIPGALTQLNLKGNQDIYLGIAQTIVLGNNVLLEPIVFRHTIDTITRNPYLSQDAYLLTTDGKASDVIEGLTEGNVDISSKFHKNNSSTLDQLPLKTIDTISEALYRTNGTLIPTVSVQDEYLKIESLSIIENLKLVGTLPNEDIDGYLFIIGQGVGTNINIMHKNTPVSFAVTSIDQKYVFKEEKTSKEEGSKSRTQLTLHMHFDINGDIEGATMDSFNIEDNEIMANLISQDITPKIYKSYTALKTYNIDPFGIIEYLRKWQPNLYNKYKSAQDIKLVIHVNVEIESTGHKV
jgi:Ger(x)C family germination protein